MKLLFPDPSQCSPLSSHTSSKKLYNVVQFVLDVGLKACSICQSWTDFVFLGDMRQSFSPFLFSFPFCHARVGLSIILMCPIRCGCTVQKWFRAMAESLLVLFVLFL